MTTLTTTRLPGLELLHRGKVRDVYAVDEERLLLVATDRISAFDRVLGSPIPDKGAVLTQTSAFWFDRLQHTGPHHLLAWRAQDMPPRIAELARGLGGRALLVRRAEVVPVECVVRGYLAGSVVEAYQKDGAIQGVALPPGIPLGGALPAPIFTPTTKAPQGHDLPLTWAELVEHVGRETAEALRARSLELFAAASAHCRAQGLLLCDTKFELGRLPGRGAGPLLLVDEALTPDSSRFFEAATHRPGTQPVPFDKQLVRDWLKAHPEVLEAEAPPVLPEEIVRQTSARYREVFQRLSGRRLDEAVAEAVA